MFTFREHYTFLNMEEPVIIGKALEAFKTATLLDGRWKGPGKGRYDGIIEINVQGQWEPFFVEIKKELRNHQLQPLIEVAKQNFPMIVVAEHIFPKIKEELRNLDIGYIETCGNVFIKTDKLLINIDGKKPEPKKAEKVNRAFTKTGLKVVFQFLLDPEILNKPYREIAKTTAVALGNINYVITGLRDYGFIKEDQKGRLNLMNREDLIQKWLAAYEQRLRPGLYVGRFRLNEKVPFEDWRNIKLKKGATCWGEEPGGAILTDYLRPEILTLYTTESRNDLIMNYHFIPDPDGNIKIYKKFWAGTMTNENAAPPLLVYADLLNTGESRCIETAQIIYERHVSKII